jgi:hypothetical protein
MKNPLVVCRHICDIGKSIMMCLYPNDSTELKSGLENINISISLSSTMMPMLKISWSDYLWIDAQTDVGHAFPYLPMFILQSCQ